MAKRIIDCDEWWPVYYLEEPEEWNARYAVEVPDDLVNRWERVQTEFSELQNELAELRK